MSNKNIKLLLLLLLLLLAFIIIKVSISPTRESNIPGTLLMVNSEDIYKIEISLEGGVPKVMERQKDGEYWKLYSESEKEKVFEARKKDIKFILESIDNLIPQEFASKDTTKSKVDEYWSSDDTGSRVILYNKKEEKIGDFIVGRTFFRFGGSDVITYVRKYEDNKIFAVKGFLSTFNKDLDGLKEKKMWDEFNEKDVVEIEYKYPEESVYLKKIDSSWILNNNIDVNDSIVDRYLFEVGYRNEASYGTDMKISGLEFEYNIRIKLKNGKEYLTKLHKVSDNFYLTKSSETNNILRVQNYIIDAVFKSSKHFNEIKK